MAVPTALKERPILFSAPMVRAILDGRKTQTRRIIKPQPRGCEEFSSELMTAAWAAGEVGVKCPYGDIGDRLWVREGTIVHASIREQLVGYAADGCRVTEHYEKAVPSIHMRRAHSRVTLKITDVRVQRLQEISEEDARAEGTDTAVLNAGDRHFARGAYRRIWEDINGAGSWDANPWVWALTFAVLGKSATEKVGAA